MMKSKHESKWDFGTLAQSHCVQPLATLKEYSFFRSIGYNVKVNRKGPHSILGCNLVRRKL